MCGICGVCLTRSEQPAQRNLVQEMCDAIVHRGPDDQGLHVEGSVGIGMRRLSIIDLDGGTQPIYNEDRSVVVVFNGEIYNFKELRKELIEKGHQFQTSSDTEVIVHAYEEYGDDFVDRLNGMYAIAIWDARKRRMILSRDRLGQKPLYYAWTHAGLTFGSELKCVLKSPDVSRNIDHGSLYHYLTVGYVPHPGSIYQDVRQLSPGSQLVVEGDRIEIKRYWRPKAVVDPNLEYAAAIEELRELLVDAVQLRLRSDVPLGAFLSGGLDSTIVVALMAQINQQPVKTFHIDFGDRDLSEVAYAREVAKRYETDHYELMIQPDAVSVLDDLVTFFDEPFGDSSAVPTYYVSQLTRQHVTVALAGDAGDETFGGYRRYMGILARPERSWIVRKSLGAVGGCIHKCLPANAPGRRFFRSLGMDNHEYYIVGTRELETREMLSPEFLEQLSGPSTLNVMKSRLEDYGDDQDALSPYTSLDLSSYLPDDILVKVDRMSMAHSLEVRSPFLDYRVVEFAMRLPHHWKVRGNEGKLFLKNAFENELPPMIRKTRKRGFSPPLYSWLRNELKPMLQDALNDRRVMDLGFFNQASLKALAKEHFDGRRDRSDQLWRFLFFVRWYHHASSGGCHDASAFASVTS